MPPRVPYGRARRSLLAVLAVLAGIVLGPAAAPGPASAHATLLRTDPVDGAVLPAAPEQVTLTFDEPVQIREGGVRMLDATGAELAAGSRSVDAQVIVALPTGLDEGTYVVSWRVISLDSHPVTGGLTFSVGTPGGGAVALPADEPGQGLRLVRQAAEAMAYAGVLGSVGLVVFLLVLLPDGAGGGEVRRRLRLALWVFAPVGGGAAVAAVPVTAAWQDGADLAALLTAQAWRTGLGSDTAWQALLILAGLTTVIVAAARSGRRRPSTRAPVIAAFAGAAAALWAFTLVGHTRTVGPGWLVVAADLLHVSTAAVWFGGLVGLAVTLSRTSDAAPSVAAGAVARFSRAAAVLVLLLGLAGVVLGWRVLQSWSALWSASHGTVLLVKVGVALAVLPLAGYNRYRLVPAVRSQSDAPTAWRRLRRTVRAEALLLVAVLAVTGVLVTQSPRADPALPEPAAAAPAASGPLRLEAALGTGQAVVRLSPGRVGTNTLELSLLDGDGRPLRPVAVPELYLSLPARQLGPLERPLSRTGPGRYEATVDFPLAGRWLIGISVRASKYDSPIAEIPVEVPAHTSDQRPGHRAESYP